MGNLNKTSSYPSGNADVKAQVPFASENNIEISNQETIIPMAQLTGASTLDLTIDQDVRAGAQLLVTAGSDGTGRTLTFGTGFTAPAEVQTASKNYAFSFKYDGSTFILVGAVQLN